MKESNTSNIPRLKKPDWIKVRPGSGAAYHNVEKIIHANDLRTVCDEALCPNKGECWSHGHATVLILGDKCTRACKFCNIFESREKFPIDCDEPRRVAAALLQTGLKEVVITSVTRDDIPDGGAEIWACTIREIRNALPQSTIEILVPDFNGCPLSAQKVIDAGPDIFGHNLETVPRLYTQIRPQASYARSLSLLRQASTSGLITKTSLMLGLGEKQDEVKAVMQDARTAGCRIIFLGQYLQPSPAHHPVLEYIEPAEFSMLEKSAYSMGYDVVVSKPLVRSSYHSDIQSAFLEKHLENRNRSIQKA